MLVCFWDFWLIILIHSKVNTLESGINIRVRLVIFEVFPGATSLLKGATFIDFWFLKNFLRIFNFLFLWLCIKESNYLLFERGLRLFKGLCLLFSPNVPGAMFIQGGTFIPASRVFVYPKISFFHNDSLPHKSENLIFKVNFLDVWTSYKTQIRWAILATFPFLV